MPGDVISIVNLIPDKCAPGSTVLFVVSEGAVCRQGSGAAPPLPLPRDTHLACVSAKLDGISMLEVRDCQCLDQSTYRSFSFVVPEDALPGAYSFSATFFAVLEDGVALRFTFEYPLLNIAGGSGTGQCQVWSVNPNAIDTHSLRTRAFTYKGAALDDIDRSTVTIRNMNSGAVYQTNVNLLTPTSLRLTIRPGSRDILSGRYKLLVNKNQEAMTRDPSRVTIAPATTFNVTKATW